MLLKEVAFSTTLQDITCGPSGPRRLWAGVPGGPNTVNPSLQVGKGNRFPGAVLVCTEAGRSAGLGAASWLRVLPCSHSGFSWTFSPMEYKET